jgi:hypothetical protein
MKFKLKDGKGSVHSFYCKGVNYYPGDIVDLPQTYEGVAWLIRVDPVPVVVPPPQKLTPVAEVVKVEPKVEALVETKEAVNWGASKKKTTTTATA